MSLKVWLPLDGDLHNQGISNITITNNGATVNDNGKIGKCYKVTASQNIIINNFTITPTCWSVACWFYPTINSSTGHRYIIGMNTSSSADFTFVLCHYQNLWAVRTAGTTYQGTSSVILNQWYHLAATYDGTVLKLYINGIEEKSQTSPAAPVAATTIKIGGRLPSGGEMSGCLNDIRIYDHCLSAAEVREISQGLVLHYKLDTYNLFNPNTLTQDIYLLSNGNTSTSGAVDNWALTEYIPVKPNTAYIGYNLVNGGNGDPSICYYDINKTYTRGAAITANTPLNITTQNNEYYVRISIRKKNNDIYKMSFLEIPNIIEDNSGFSHNGTITGTPTISTNSPRYSYCTNLISGQKISTTGLFTTPNPIFTVNFWIKMYSNTYTAWKDVMTFNGNKQFRMEVNNASGQRLAWYNYPIGTSTGIFNANVNYDEWNMLTLVWNGSSIITYKNGEEATSVAISGTEWTPDGSFSIGDAGMYMYISDVRIYCTALDVDSILQLYHTSAKVDNKGGIHTYEFNEVSGSKITKNGVVKFNFIGENINYNQKTEIGKQIHPNLLKGSNQIGNMTIGKYGWISNGTASNIEILHDNIIHYSYNLSDSKYIPSITTNSSISCELGKTYTYTMELKCDQPIKLGTNVPMHFWSGARTTDVDTNTSCNGHLSGITYNYVLNHNNDILPANTWIKIVTRFTFPTSISESNYPYPAIRCFIYGSVLSSAYTGEVNVWMRNCKVEEGTDSTPWVPHIDDGCSSIINTESGWINGTQLIEL